MCVCVYIAECAGFIGGCANLHAFCSPCDKRCERKAGREVARTRVVDEVMAKQKEKEERKRERQRKVIQSWNTVGETRRERLAG